MNVNLFDTHSKRYVTVTPMLEHTLPGEGDLLAFEAYDERFKDFPPERLSLTDFKVVCHRGFIVGVRVTLRAPRAIYTTVAQLQERMFAQFRGVAVAPAALNPHPLIHVIPAGIPGAGSIVVRDVARLRSGGEPERRLTFVEREAHERNGARQALVTLGFTLKGDGDDAGGDDQVVAGRTGRT